MAKVTKLVDDLNGSEAEMTLVFGLDGQDYEIDLNDENYEQYRAALELLAAHGRKVERQMNFKRSTTAKRATPSGGTAHIREFLRSLGHNVSDRGRIPDHLMKLWESREVITESSPKPAQTKNVTAADVQDKVNALPDEDDDAKAEQEVIARVKAEKPKTTRGKAKPAPKAEFSGLREALSLEEGK